ncbi:unnamed protein product [Caenorhabditis sp. 36 PRJEB53466]|nr:unnamed protein product [Caenorhabditis sp. 36 PRJEB53466]
MASEGSAGNDPKQEEQKDPNEGKRFFKFVFNVNKKCADETEMTPEFLADVKHYSDYDEAVTKCIQYTENMFIPFGSKKNEEDSFCRVAQALSEFKALVPPSYSAQIDGFANTLRAASASRKSHQAIQSYQLRHLKRFHEHNYEGFAEQKKKFDDSRRKMDQAKADVRAAKTTTAIEKKAICYQLAVDDFDQQTEELIKIIEALPKCKAVFAHDILVVVTKHKMYHNDMAKFFASACP